MDLADHADQAADLHLRLALARRVTAAPATGRCHWCEAPTPGAYCDADCRADHARHAAAQARGAPRR